jgi:hypothetical protein
MRVRMEASWLARGGTEGGVATATGRGATSRLDEAGLLMEGAAADRQGHRYNRPVVTSSLEQRRSARPWEAALTGS